MYSDFAKTVVLSDEAARYDAAAKRLLGNKHILAHILAKTIDEFRGMRPADIVPLIEGGPYINLVPVDPGLTNAASEDSGERVIGLNTEDSEVAEGVVRFDIICYVRMRDGVSQVIVNVEAQKDSPSGYRLMHRAVYYACRLVSSQKERDFANSNYDEIKRVFSIWICMDMGENIMIHVHLSKDELIGSYPHDEGLDLINIVLIGLSDDIPPHDETYELHRLLCTLFSEDLQVPEKLEVMEREYDIPINNQSREEVDEMSSLLQIAVDRKVDKIIDKAVNEAIAQDHSSLILRMHQKGYATDQIADLAEISVQEVEGIIQKNAPVLS